MSYQMIVLLQLSSKLFCLNLSWLLPSVNLSGNPTSHHCILALLEIVDSTGCWYTGYKAKLISSYQKTFCTKPMGLLFILLTVNHRKPPQKNKTRNILLTWQWLHQGAKNFTKWFPNATCSSKVSSVKSIKPSAITSLSWTDWKCKPIQVVYNYKFI